MKTSDLSGAELDTLIALVENGPLEDGDLPSKSGRSSLLQRGFAVQVVVKGRDGWQAATINGARAYCEYFGEAKMADAKAARIARRSISDAIYRSKNP